MEDIIRPFKRRRRRRCCDSNNFENPSSTRRLHDLVDDGTLQFSQNNYPPRDNKAKIAVHNAWPSLLFQRQSTIMTNTRIGNWQRSALAKTVEQNGNKKVSWRNSVSRQISFLDLGTPFTEALLALDPSGSFMVSVADEVRTSGEAGVEYPTMYLSVRGVPSPARLQANTRDCPISPRLLTLPLEFATQGTQGRFSKRKVILSFCQDWRLGLVLCPATNKIRDPAAHIIVFPLPRALSSSDTIINFFKTKSAVSLPDVVGSMDGYNLLWEVECIPHCEPDGLASRSIFKRRNSFLCLLRHHEDLRLTWFSDSATPELFHELEMPSTYDAANVTAKDEEFSDGLILPCHQSFWNAAYSQRLDGSLVNNVNVGSKLLPRVSIVHEATLSLTCLVQELLCRRPKLAKRYDESNEKHRLEWKSEVIDVAHQGRILNLLIAFSPGKAKYPVAVAVSVDPLSQKYREHSWMKSTTVFAHIDMRTLSANFRMKLLRCGPYEIERPAYDDLFAADEGSPGLHYASQNEEYCFMPLSSLYTDTQVVSNSNILCAVPRMSIKSRSPVELVYYGDC